LEEKRRKKRKKEEKRIAIKIENKDNLLMIKK
jgi:hypothetical protein